MIPDTKYGAFNIPFKDFTFEWPVGRSLEFALCIARNPEIGPDEQSVPVACFKEFIAGRNTSSPYPYKIYI